LYQTILESSNRTNFIGEWGGIMPFKVKIEQEGLKQFEIDKVMLAAERIEIVFNSDQFKEWCLNFYWTEKICTGSLWWKKCRIEQRKFFHYNDGLTNFQVYNKIMAGKEDLSSDGVDNEADIFVKVDRSSRRGVIGYTYPSSKWQYIYGWVLNDWDFTDIASNLAHEWCHKVGFDHEYNKTYARQYSVPYAVGYYVGDFKA
jgi:hypothetical protein